MIIASATILANLLVHVLAASMTPNTTTGGSGIGGKKRVILNLNHRVKIVGVKGDDYFAFRGIPYAQADRWQEPKPIDLLTLGNEIDATRPGTQCVQQTRLDLVGEEVGKADVSNLPQGEACLNLTVYRPRRLGEAGEGDEARFPVLMVWHPGNFVAGSNALPCFDYGQLAATLHLVVVVPNYRLGVAGFLAAPNRPHGHSSNGNWGLLDLLESARWVQRHIGLFGGMERSVTLLGHSAGALMAHLLTLQLQQGGVGTAPPWHRLILASGTAGLKPPRSLRLALQETRNLVKLTGCSDFDCLARRPMEELARIAHHGGYDGIFSPCIDGVAVLGDPNLLNPTANSSKSPKIPILFTWTEANGHSFIPMGLSSKEYPMALEALFAHNNPTVIKAYPIGSSTVPNALGQIITDRLFAYPAIHHSRLMTLLRWPVGLHRWQASDLGINTRPLHGADLAAYATGNLPASIIAFIREGTVCGCEAAKYLPENKFVFWSGFGWEKVALVNAHLRLDGVFEGAEAEEKTAEDDMDIDSSPKIPHDQ